MTLPQPTSDARQRLNDALKEHRRKDVPFKVKAPFEPSGDQPKAILEIEERFKKGERDVVLMGATGTGKSATCAWVIEKTQRPTLIIEPNKTLAAQLAAELRELLPDNAVEYFVSYYDYYQPEAYVPQSDTYIEKDSAINEEIERLRHSATRMLLTRRDVVVVATVSAIYGLGAPADYLAAALPVAVGMTMTPQELSRKLVEMMYSRNDTAPSKGQFRLRGDTLDIHTTWDPSPIRVEFFGDEIERVQLLHPVTYEPLKEQENLAWVFPASHYTPSTGGLQRAVGLIEDELEQRVSILEKQGKLLEAQRLQMRTRYDLEQMNTLGMCKGIENYSRHLDGREKGTPPACLLDYFPDDFLMVVDESHVTNSQIGAMHTGDASRKATLVEHGFRLPSALDNRPLTFDEFRTRTGQTLHMSATPGKFELGQANGVVEQLIRPTGLVDPQVEIRPTKGQVDDLMEEIRTRVLKQERVLVTVLTKRMAEDLTDYLTENNIKVRYLHSDVETLKRIELLRDLRRGKFDVLVGINLLREGLDLPEVSLVTIFDADKEGFLRSHTSLIQTIGRAARNLHGKVIMYADKETPAMKAAISETTRRRDTQIEYNTKNGIDPTPLFKQIKDITDFLEEQEGEEDPLRAMKEDLEANLSDLDGQDAVSYLRREAASLTLRMKAAAEDLNFEMAAALRDHLKEVRKEIQTLEG